MADSIHISTKIKHGTVAKCLQVVAGVADWEISFSGRFQRRSAALIGDRPVFFGDVVSVFENREHLDGSKKDDPRVVTPMDALKACVFDAARKLEEEDPFVISLRPRSPEPSEGKK